MDFRHTVRRAVSVVIAHGLFLSVALVASTHSASAQTRTAINTLFFTGVTNTGASASDTSVDAHYKLVGDPTNLTSLVAPGSLYITKSGQFPIGPWMDYSAGNGASRWIEPTSGTESTHAPGDFTIRTTFNLTGFVASSAQLSLKMAADNAVTEVRVNGTKITGAAASSFTTFSSATFITSTDVTFLNGDNTIDFVLSNGTGLTSNPTGLRVEASGTAITASAAPEPGALPLLTLGLVLMGGGSRVMRARRTKRTTGIF